MSTSPPRPAPITDSPWFWLRLFSGVALVALVAMAPRYQQRQGVIERRYNARQDILEHGTQAEEDEAEAPPIDESPLQIPLLPLVVVAGGVFLAATVAMHLERSKARQEASSWIRENSAAPEPAHDQSPERPT